MSDNPIIRTSEVAWLRKLAEAYKAQTPVQLIDDAHTGIDPAQDSLFSMARSAHLSPREIAGVCVALGMSGAGVAMVVLAFIDPEPTSKLTLLVGGGALICFTGGVSAISILTRKKPPKITLSKTGAMIEWPE